MIEYIKEIFTKPEIELSTIDRFAILGLAFLALIVIIGLLSAAIILPSAIKERYKHRTCDKTACNYYEYNRNGCTRCGKYRKKVKVKESKDNQGE